MSSMSCKIPRQVLLFSITVLLCIISWSTTFGFSLIRNLSYQRHALASPLFAKKKKGGKNNKKKQNSKSGFEWATSFTLKPFESQSGRELSSIACASFEGYTGKPLSPTVKGATDIPKALWNAPIACAVVALQENLDNEGSAIATQPVIKYANAAALETVGLREDQFEELIASTDPKTGLAKVTENMFQLDLPSQLKGDKKYESGYKKKIVRGTSQDGDIMIVDAHRWSIDKSTFVEGKFATERIGVAYAWSEWTEGPRTLCRVGGERKVLFSQEELEAAVQEQAASIRQLKEEQGLGNKDPQVQAAVAKLLELKELLAKVEAS